MSRIFTSNVASHESRRVGSKVQQKTLVNLGESFSIPKPQWAELIEIIEAKLVGNEFLFEPTPELAAAAESIVQRLRSRELEKPTDDSLDGDTAHIKLDSVEMDNARSVGSERLALASLEALVFPGVLKDVCGKACNGVPQRGGIGDQFGLALICCRNSFSSSNPFSSNNDGTASRVDLRRKDRAGPAAAPHSCPSVPQ